MNALKFQQNAIDELIVKFKHLWDKKIENGAQLLLESPTGSGKTYMTTSFINRLNDEPDWQNQDAAFIWITFSDTLAMQSRDKFREYFSGNLNNQLLTVDDFKQGILNRNDILFINWQKLVSQKAENRVLRRPEDARNNKEQGYYFEDIIENTHAKNRSIVLVIDESHKNVTDSADRDVISKLNARIVLKISATPFNSDKEKTEFYAQVGMGNADIVVVKQEDVVAEGLIKSKIVCQTEEELKTHKVQDLDELMLELAIERRMQVALEWQKLGMKINPLVLIQLPNDDKELEKEGVPTKESVVKNYLEQKGIPNNRIASWFDNKKENMEFITQNDCPVDFLLFKIAAGTGWDCPRAQILVMYREIKKTVFHKQTLGRILRMPYIDASFSNDLLTTGYLYTNYTNNEVGIPNQDGNNRPKIYSAEIKTDTKKQLVVNDFTGKFSEIIKTENKNSTEKIDDNKLEAIVSSVSNQVKTFATAAVFQTDEGKKDSESNVTIAAQIEKKSGDLKSAVLSIIEKNVPKSIVSEVKRKTQSLIEDIDSIAKNNTETGLIIDVHLKSDFLSRSDYGDIGKVSEFQKYFIQFMNEYFMIDGHKVPYDFSDNLKTKGISLDTDLSQVVMANAVYYSENSSTKDQTGTGVQVQMSANDVEKNFTWKCYEILGEQIEEDAKIGNRARSWGPFKAALCQWFRKYALANNTLDEAYRIFLNDTYKSQSVFKQAITFSLKKYRPILNAFIKERVVADAKAESFTIKTHYAYSDDYAVFTDSKRSLVQPFYLRKVYNGRKNEVAFIKYLEEAPEVEWWFKNGDSGKEFLSIKYLDTTVNHYRLFYPDWLVKLNDGRICILDTKGGITASSQDTKDKAEELHRRIVQLNAISSIKYTGGIVISTNGEQWYIQSESEYNYNPSNLTSSGWKTLAWKAL